jgi:hypothetical protein
MMLVLKDLGKTVAGGLLDVFVTFIHKIDQHRYKIRMDFWHIKEVDRLLEIIDKFGVLSPHTGIASNIIHKDHEALQEI